MTDNFKQTFNIIKRVNDPKSAVTLWGETVYRVDKVFVDNFVIQGQTISAFIDVVNDAHFIYEMHDHPRYANMPTPRWMCTCGAIAGVLSIRAFVGNMTITMADTSIKVVKGTLQGAKLACLFRYGMIDKETGEQYGFHSDGTP